MKNLFLFFIAAFLAFTSDVSAKAVETTSESFTCNWNSWFKYPKNNATYDAGKSVYVRVDAQRHQDISFMELYVNGKFVRKESSYPYEWAKGSGSSDHYLRNLKAGTYKLKVRIKDRCGNYHEKYCTFYVKGGHDNGGNTGGHCEYKAWFKYPSNGKTYRTGSDVYVKLDAQHYNKMKYVELYINGRFIRKETSYPYEWAKGSGNSDHYLRNMKNGTYKLKARVYDQCGKYKDFYCTFYVKGGHDNGGNTGGHCEYQSWFKYPKNNASFRHGSDVYVRIDTKKYQDIQEMQLYLNGKFIRKETSYPYEWAKGSGNSDHYLRNMKRGSYSLKVRIKTKCGGWHEYYCKFYVK